MRKLGPPIRDPIPLEGSGELIGSVSVSGYREGTGPLSIGPLLHGELGDRAAHDVGDVDAADSGAGFRFEVFQAQGRELLTAG